MFICLELLAGAADYSNQRDTYGLVLSENNQVKRAEWAKARRTLQPNAPLLHLLPRIRSDHYVPGREVTRYRERSGRNGLKLMELLS